MPSLEASGTTVTAVLTFYWRSLSGSLCRIVPLTMGRLTVLLSDFLAYLHFFDELLKATDGLIFCRRKSKSVRCVIREVAAGWRLPDLTTM